MGPIKEAFTFDDVTLAPNYSGIMPSDVITETVLSKYLTLKIPLLSSAMDTVTESKMSIAIAKAGGIGVIHRNLDIKKQISEIKKVKSKNLLVGAAVGAGPAEIKRAEAILKEKIDLIFFIISKVKWSSSIPIFLGGSLLPIIETIAFKKLSLFQSV